MTSRRIKPPIKTSAAAVVTLRSPSHCLRQYRAKGINMPTDDTEKEQQAPGVYPGAKYRSE